MELSQQMGKVTFDAGATGKTIDAGNSNFYDAEFNNASGGWTIRSENFVCIHNLAITSISALTVNSVTVEVHGTYSIGNSAPTGTTWTAATLYLNSGTNYTVGSKSQSTEAYSTLQIGADTDVRMWDSSASTYTVDASGSLYSQDQGVLMVVSISGVIIIPKRMIIGVMLRILMAQVLLVVSAKQMSELIPLQR